MASSVPERQRAQSDRPSGVLGFVFHDYPPRLFRMFCPYVSLSGLSVSWLRAVIMGAVALAEDGDGDAEPRVHMSVKMPRRVARRVDLARGSMSRSAWLELAVLAFLELGGAAPERVERGLSDRLRRALAGPPEVYERLRAAQSRALPAACPHRKRSVYCVRCRCLVDGEGFPVAVP